MSLKRLSWRVGTSEPIGAAIERTLFGEINSMDNRNDRQREECITQGATIEEVLAMARDAIELYIADEDVAPDGEQTIVATVTVGGPEKIPA